MMKRILRIVAHLAFLPSTVVAQQSPAEIAPSAEIVRGELGDSLDAYMSRLEVFGLSGALLVAKDGDIVLRKGYGLADRESGAPIDVNTPFPIGSLSKQFTAAAILKLAEQDRLSVDDPISAFFPDAPEHKAGITLHQLLTHTAGLPYLSGDLMEQAPRSEIMREMLSLPLQSEPGTQYAYSNPGYTLLAGVIEMAAGQSYEDFLRDHLFTPAGMHDTGFLGDSRWESARVHSYSGTTDEGVLPDFPRMPKAVGAGTVISTLGDLYRWEQALRDHQVLSRASTERFFTPHVATGQGPLQYAYGWIVAPTVRGTQLVTHDGDLGGYNAGYRRYTDEALVVIFLSNARADGPGYRDAVMNNLSLRIAGLPHLAVPAVVPPSSERAALAGRYRLPSGGLLQVEAAPQGVRVIGDAQEEISFLAGASPEVAAHAAALNARADSVIRGLLEGDASAARAHAHPSFPVDDGAGLIEQLRGYEQQLGSLQEIAVLGTAIPSPATAKTFVRLVYPRGEVIESVAWVGGKLALINHDLGQPLSVLFAPTSQDDYRSLDMFTGTVLQLVPEMEGGTVEGIRLTGPGGAVRARRVDD